MKAASPVRRRTVRRPEEDLQKSVVQFLRAAAVGCVWFAVPNQKGTRTTWEQGLLKSLGVRAGVADLVFVLDGGRIAFIELKDPDGGRQSADQALFEGEVRRLDAPYLICRSIAEVQGALTAWGVRLRGRVCE